MFYYKTTIRCPKDRGVIIDAKTRVEYLNGQQNKLIWSYLFNPRGNITLITPTPQNCRRYQLLMNNLQQKNHNNA